MRRAVVFLLTVFCATVARADEPLIDAAARGDKVAAQKLIASGAAVDVRGADNATALIVAALSGAEDVARLLIAQGADVKARNAGGFTALHAAAYQGSVPVVALLLDSNAPRDDAENKAGVTPVFVAAEMNHPEVIELLVSRGADIGKPESHGYSAMTRAFWKGNKEVVSLLKTYGQTCQKDKLTQTEYAKCLDIK